MLLSFSVFARISARVIGASSLGLGLLESSLSYYYSLRWICFVVITI
jgi:hypothetical protein